MHKRNAPPILSALLGVFVAALLACTPAALAAEGVAGLPERVFVVHYLPYHQAKLLIEEKLGQDPASLGNYEIEAEPPRGDTSMSPTGYLRVRASRDVHAKIEAFLKQTDVPLPDRVLHVYLLEASKQPASAPELPAGAMKAVRDLQEVMPFRGFRLLESGLLRSARTGQVALGSDFVLEFAFRRQRDPDGRVLVERFFLRREVPSKADKEGEYRVLIDTSFLIRPGETVVVGTSKLDGGDDALVVLVTAIE
jgi:hypothetical protein